MKRLLTALAVGVLLLPGSVFAQTIDASSLLPTVAIRFSPSSGTFIEGSTFQVPILLDTRGASVNTIELRIYFDPTKLSIVQPSSDRSIIGLWLEPPSYDNTAGTARYVGAIPNGFSNTIASAVDSLSGGITTSAGIIGTITFKAKSAGLASVTIRNDSEVLLNLFNCSQTTRRSDYLLRNTSITISVVQQPKSSVCVGAPGWCNGL